MIMFFLAWPLQPTAEMLARLWDDYTRMNSLGQGDVYPLGYFHDIHQGEDLEDRKDTKVLMSWLNTSFVFLETSMVAISKFQIFESLLLRISIVVLVKNSILLLAMNYAIKKKLGMDIYQYNILRKRRARVYPHDLAWIADLCLGVELMQVLSLILLPWASITGMSQVFYIAKFKTFVRFAGVHRWLSYLPRGEHCVFILVSLQDLITGFLLASWFYDLKKAAIRRARRWLQEKEGEV